MDKQLHIVTHDIPWPADYGGVIDIFYTIKALHSQGVRIYLHCFTNKRLPQPELNKYCKTVNYYQRKKNFSSFSFNIPLIVNSRASEELMRNLQQDNHPVLLEGVHSTFLLHNDQLKNRKLIVRLFNTEFVYYKQLAKLETNIFRKLYFEHETRLLKKYEKAIAGKAGFLALSMQDVELYRNEFAAPDVNHLPAFIPYTSVESKAGNGCFCLYHGNLAVNENEKAVLWLLENIFSKNNLPFVIAGKNPSKKLERLAHNHQHTCLVANPSDKEMQDMIAKAHVHVLPSFNNTGVKLKLLNAIFNGRHCLVNKAGVAGSGLESYCQIADDADSFKQKIEALYLQPFSESEIDNRNLLLQQLYNNENNALKLIQFLY